MNELLKNEELHLDGCDWSRYSWRSPQDRRLETFSFIAAWQLADCIEDFADRLDMVADASARADIESWSVDFEKKLENLKEAGEFENEWDRKRWKSWDNDRLHYSITSETETAWVKKDLV